jgi:hypothetical protein
MLTGVTGVMAIRREAAGCDELQLSRCFVCASLRNAPEVLAKWVGNWALGRVDGLTTSVGME